MCVRAGVLARARVCVCGGGGGCQRKTKDRADGMREKVPIALDGIRTCISGIRAHSVCVCVCVCVCVLCECVCVCM